MKPVNYNISNCESTSSDCIIWQGRDIPCLNLCNGDTITKVIYDLGIKLCDVLDQLDISNYELSCIATLGGIPSDFKSFINLLITKVCQTSSVSETTQSVNNDCPNCIVPLAPYFQFPDPNTGDLVTKDLVQNYIQKIGITVTSLVSEIQIAQRATTNLGDRITVLENKATPTFELPNLYPTGIADSNVLLPLDEFTAILEQQFVALREAIGDTTEIYNSITTPPSDFNNAKALGTSGGVLGTLPGWVEDPKNLSDSITNAWLTIIDLRSAVRNIQLNITTACEGIEIDFSGTLESKILKLFFNGIIPTNLDSCQFQGSLFKVTDNSGNYFNTFVDIKNNMNNSSGVTIDLNSTSLNFADDLKVISVFCFTDLNTGTTCQNVLDITVNNNFNCPTLNVIPSITSVGFNFTHTEGTLTYSVQLFDHTNTMIQSENYGVSSAITILGNFSSLVANSLYKIRLQMITASNTKTCPFVSFNTLPNPCAAPNTITAMITY